MSSLDNPKKGKDENDLEYMNRIIDEERFRLEMEELLSSIKDKKDYKEKIMHGKILGINSNSKIGIRLLFSNKEQNSIIEIKVNNILKDIFKIPRDQNIPDDLLKSFVALLHEVQSRSEKELYFVLKKLPDNSYYYSITEESEKVLRDEIDKIRSEFKRTHNHQEKAS